MTPTTFDERARTLTHSLLSDAARIPAESPRERSASPWRAVAAFTATAVVLVIAVLGASIALHRSPAGKASPAANLSARWKSFVIPDIGGGLNAISCPDPSNCVAVDYEGDVVTSTNPGGGAAAWNVASVDPMTQLTGVSCADPSLCVAVDQYGDVVTSTDPGGGAGAWILSGVDGQVSLTGISCPDEELCVAVGGVVPTADPTSGTYGVVLSSTDPAGGPGTWKVTAVDAYSLTAVSCPSPSLCVALDENGKVVTSTDPTGGSAAWNAFGVDQGPGGFTAISCPGAFLCVAVDDEGNVATATDPAGGSSAWTLSNISPDITGLPDLFSVSCPSTTFCVIGSGSESAIVSSDPTGGSGSWTSAPTPAQGVLTIYGISCPTSGFCVGVDGGQFIRIYRDPSA
jgi:hypothetical protein